MNSFHVVISVGILSLRMYVQTGCVDVWLGRPWRIHKEGIYLLCLKHTHDMYSTCSSKSVSKSGINNSTTGDNIFPAASLAKAYLPRESHLDTMPLSANNISLAAHPT